LWSSSGSSAAGRYRNGATALPEKQPAPRIRADGVATVRQQRLFGDLEARERDVSVVAFQPLSPEVPGLLPDLDAAAACDRSVRIPPRHRERPLRATPDRRLHDHGRRRPESERGAWPRCLVQSFVVHVEAVVDPVEDPLHQAPAVEVVFDVVRARLRAEQLVGLQQAARRE